MPQLATSYEMSPDLKSMTLKLRPGVVFQDGTPCDAAAVKFSIERMMDKKRNTTNRPLWDPIVAVETPDQATVVLRTAEPFAALPNSLAHGSGAIVSPANVQNFGETGVVQKPVGAGPYMVESFNPGQNSSSRRSTSTGAASRGGPAGLPFDPRGLDAHQRAAHRRRRRDRCGPRAARSEPYAGRKRSDPAQGRAASFRRCIQFRAGAPAGREGQAGP